MHSNLQANEMTKAFLRFLKEKIDLPIYGLTYLDPWGISIVKTFAKGLENLAYNYLDFAVIFLH